MKKRLLILTFAVVYIQHNVVIEINLEQNKNKMFFKIMVY